MTQYQTKQTPHTKPGLAYGHGMSFPDRLRHAMVSAKIKNQAELARHLGLTLIGYVMMIIPGLIFHLLAIWQSYNEAEKKGKAPSD